MGIGGKAPDAEGSSDATLLKAYTGRTYFSSTRWNRCEASQWVLDYLNSGQQRQSVGEGLPFQRLAGIAALYEPGTRYREYQEKGKFVDESYITFHLYGTRDEAFRRLTGPEGWAHVRDPHSAIDNLLRRLGEVIFYRGPGHTLEAQGIFLELLGILEGSLRIEPHLRKVRAREKSQNEEGIVAVTERYIRNHIDEPIEVEELAGEVGMGHSTFAHKYPAVCGETPYQTVLRLKIETAKRLLLWENLSVKEVAARTGFSSPFHLSRVFKRLEGFPPSKWRQQLTEKGKLVSG
ncbi:MAG: helix-turn-helix transcriptional regulator [Planctomycetes bacterium]|nr:helix-turn-helix transcriptional regulator [Planctomycetota bacterium]